MASIAVVPFLMTDVMLTLGTDSYEKHVSEVLFTPSASPVIWKGLSPASVFSFMPTASWTCQLSYAQDWATTNSLSKYLLANEGESVAATFDPINGGPTVSATLLITPGAIGGQVDGVAVATAVLGVLGKPTLGS